MHPILPAMQIFVLNEKEFQLPFQTVGETFMEPKETLGIRRR